MSFSAWPFAVSRDHFYDQRNGIPGRDQFAITCKRKESDVDSGSDRILANRPQSH